MTTGPIAVGGIGGSGTRIVARALQDVDVFIGTDLPPSTDTIWYAVLFGRRNVLLDSPDTMYWLTSLFFEQMSNPRPLTSSELAQLRGLCEDPRIQPPPATQAAWLESFVTHCERGTPAPVWGWKLPYTYMLIDRFLTRYDDLKYVHMCRDGRDMAFSKNQNQLAHWGPLFLNRDIAVGPRDSLAFWCAVHRYVEQLKARFPQRILELHFEDLVSEPDRHLTRLFDFVSIDVSPERIAELSTSIQAPDSIGRFNDHDMAAFRPQDVSYAELVAETRENR